MKIISRRLVTLIMVLAVSLSCVNTIPVYAGMADEAQMYEMGEEYRGRCKGSWGRDYYKFTVLQKSRIMIDMSYLSTDANWEVHLLDADGNKVIDDSDFLRTRDKITEDLTAELARFIEPGTYYFEIAAYDLTYTFTIKEEDQIKLPRGEISYLTAGNGQAAVSCKEETNAIGYKIWCSASPTFKSKKVIMSPDASTTISGLKNGRTYYFKAAPYNVYDDGTYIYGKTSAVKRVKIR